MAQELQSRIEYLESEIRNKDAIISELHHSILLARVTPGYLHEMENCLSMLSFKLYELFKACRSEQTSGLIQEVTQGFERLRDLTRSFSQLTRQKPTRRILLNSIIQDVMRSLHPLCREFQIATDVTMDKETDKYALPSPFSLAFMNIVLNGIDALKASAVTNPTLKIVTMKSDQSIVIKVSINGLQSDSITGATVALGFNVNRGDANNMGRVIAAEIVESLGGTISAITNRDMIIKFSTSQGETA